MTVWPWGSVIFRTSALKETNSIAGSATHYHKPTPIIGGGLFLTAESLVASKKVAQSSRLGLEAPPEGGRKPVVSKQNGEGEWTTDEKTVSEWFSAMDFEAQRTMLEKLNEVHDKVRQVRISALKRELLMLENGLSNGHVEKPAKRAKKKARVAVKYRNPSPAARGRDAAGWRHGWPKGEGRREGREVSRLTHGNSIALKDKSPPAFLPTGLLLPDDRRTALAAVVSAAAFLIELLHMLPE